MKQESERQSHGVTYNDNDLVFCRPDGSPFDPDTISGQFERLVRRSGLPRIRFHDLRHTHATLLLEAHEDITVVSRRLGHANVQITADRHAHAMSRLRYDAAERFSALFDGSSTSPGPRRKLLSLRVAGTRRRARQQCGELVHRASALALELLV